MNISESDINQVIAPLEAKKKELEKQRAERLFIANRYTILQNAFVSEEKIAEYYDLTEQECPSDSEIAKIHLSDGGLNSQIRSIDDMIASIRDAEKRLIQE